MLLIPVRVPKNKIRYSYIWSFGLQSYLIRSYIAYFSHYNFFPPFLFPLLLASSLLSIYLYFIMVSMYVYRYGLNTRI
jgi:hypothetical protein